MNDWVSFCRQKNFNVFNPETGQVLSWLSNLYFQGSSYASINTARSALAFIVGEKIGKNYYISRFLRGVYLDRPSKPKYDKIYDLDPVLLNLEKMYPLNKLSLADLTTKLVALLALVTAHRRQTISMIRISNIKRTSSGLEIKIPQRIKTSRPGAFQPLLVLPEFLQKPELCVVKTLDFYISITAKFRNNCDELLLSTRKPFKAASNDTISRWLRSFLVKCGISDFASHSFRHAATSAAMKKGINFKVINSLAGWSEKSNVFNKFYNRPIVRDKSSFAKAVVLNNGKTS